MLLKKLSKEFAAVFLAAADDTVKNIFRPVHNVRVILGAEKEPTIAEQIRAARKKYGLET